MNDIEQTLSERGARYGAFTDHARLSQTLKSVMQTGRNWNTLSFDQREALEMTAHKIARILNGDADFHDSWHDCVGYLKLVANRLEEEQTNG